MVSDGQTASNGQGMRDIAEDKRNNEKLASFLKTEKF